MPLRSLVECRFVLPISTFRRSPAAGNKCIFSYNLVLEILKHDNFFFGGGQFALPLPHSKFWEHVHSSPYNKVTNSEIRYKVSTLHGKPLRIMSRKENFNCHNSWQIPDDRPMKRVMMGMTEGSKLRGRLTRRWSDNYVEWYGCTF